MFVPLCDGLRGGAKRYMLMGPSVRKADSSFIRLYYTKQHTPRHAHTCMYTQSIRSTCATQRRHKQTHHTKEGNRERLNPSILEDGVCLYQACTLDGAEWRGLLSPVWAQTIGTDGRGWVNIFILKGRMDWSSFCLSAFASVKLLPQYTPEKAHI